uniref:Uncharacterized protein n=1 Tax=candidate division WOR-3 bacterium TaxID=2052148 RepID=A0A7V3ZZQ6_UNCW3
MPWRTIIILLLLLLYILFWFLVEPVFISKRPVLKQFRFHFDLFVTLVFFSAVLLVVGLPVWVVIILFGIVVSSQVIGISYLTKEKEEIEQYRLELKERDLVEWNGEIYEVRNLDKKFVRAVSEKGEIYIPFELLYKQGFKKLRKVLPRQVVFSVYFPVELYLQFVRKLEDFLKNSTCVLVSPSFSVEFVSLAINEVEVKITFYTENLASENQFWEEFLSFIEKERLSVNRVLKHGEDKTYWW